MSFFTYSHTGTNIGKTKNTSVSGANLNLCEVDTEYPSLKQSSIPRHLCVCTQSKKASQTTTTDKLSNKETSDQHNPSKNSSTQNSKIAKEGTELIDLFQYTQDEDINDKLYKKRRYQLTTTNDFNDDNENRDNTN